MILVTGAKGSVGTALVARLGDVVATDLPELDVTRQHVVDDWCISKRPHVIYHLAGAKHAPQGELDPAHVAEVNITGTLNILRGAACVGGAKVVFASTCKACDPETAYGASKLIAERAVLNAGGVVVRYFNIPESDGNVFRLWESIPETDPIPWTDCWRYFVSMRSAIDLTTAAADLPSGRYAPSPGAARHMRDVALALYPGRALRQIPPRRGDRCREPLKAESENAEEVNGYLKITSPHDP